MSIFLCAINGLRHLTRFNRINQGHIPADALSATDKMKATDRWLFFRLSRQPSLTGGHCRIRQKKQGHRKVAPFGPAAAAAGTPATISGSRRWGYGHHPCRS